MGGSYTVLVWFRGGYTVLVWFMGGYTVLVWFMGDYTVLVWFMGGYTVLVWFINKLSEDMSIRSYLTMYVRQNPVPHQALHCLQLSCCKLRWDVGKRLDFL